MVKQFAKYMKYGKVVECSWTAGHYKLIEDMDEAKETVMAVAVDNWRRYELLGAWMRNWDKDEKFRERFTGNIEECAKERKGYEEELRIKYVKPANRIRFITSEYKTIFEADDLSMVLVDGKSKRAYYIDEYHFGFVGGLAYHICQFAEICERSGIEVKPIEKNTVLGLL